MQKTGSRKPIDRWILWKLARMKKGEYDDVTRVVVEKIVSCQTYICIYLVNFICLYIYIVNFICSLFYMTLEASYIFWRMS